MARVKRGVTSHARHKKVLKLAKGSRGASSRLIKSAKQRVDKDLQYAYRDRRTRKRQMRGLWIQRINAGARLNGLTCLLYTSPSPRDRTRSRMPSSA